MPKKDETKKEETKPAEEKPYLFRARIKDGFKLFKTMFETMGNLIDEATIKIDKGGISTITADRAMVAVVDLNVPATVFEEYDLDKTEKASINITNFVSILKRANPQDELIVELTKSQLIMSLKSVATRKFTIPLLDLGEVELPPIDQLQFASNVRIKSEVLKTGIEDAKLVSDSVVFQSTLNKFAMRSQGDISSADLELEKDNPSLLGLESKGEIKARYPLDYLKKLDKLFGEFEEVKIEYGKDYPLKLTAEIQDKGKIAIIIAPRVSEE
jgi:proliferating cell nuclear antigen PCNA